MAMSRPATALDSRRFGKRSAVRADAQTIRADAQAIRAGGVDDDFRLFAATFAAGFLFVSILIA